MLGTKLAEVVRATSLVVLEYNACYGVYENYDMTENGFHCTICMTSHPFRPKDLTTSSTNPGRTMFNEFMRKHITTKQHVATYLVKYGPRPAPNTQASLVRLMNMVVRSCNVRRVCANSLCAWFDVRSFHPPTVIKSMRVVKSIVCCDVWLS